MAIRRKQIAFLMITGLILVLLGSQPVSAGGFSTWNSMSSATASDFNGIWGSGSANIFVVGSAGSIMHYDGSSWSSMISGTGRDLYGIWGDSANDIFAIGSAGIIEHYDGSRWSQMNSGTASDLNGIWGSDYANVFAVGSAGAIMHYDGSSWSSMNSGITKDLYAIWGADSSNIFAVGSSGAIIRYDGSSWNSMNSGTANDLHGVWAADRNNIFAVGSAGTILRYDGSSWRLTNSGITNDLYGVWGSGVSNVFVVGDSGVIVQYDGSNFNPMNRNIIKLLRAVRGFSPADIFTVGGSGTVLRYIPPSIESISTDQADQGTTLTVTINGTNLGGTSGVSIGQGISVNSFTVISANQIKALITIVAGAAAGPRDVTVTTPGGSFTLPDSFIVRSALPAITGISPAQDRQGTTLNVTITGSSLTGASAVEFGPGIAVNSFNVLSANQITASITITPDAVSGQRDVSVTTPAGSITLPNSFTVRSGLPTITAVSSNQGNRETQLTVTIDGTNLTGASEVRFGPGITVKTPTVLSKNQIAVDISIASDAAIGPRDVTVTTPGGSFTLPGGFTIKQAMPAVTAISVDHGNQAATLNVIIDGNNLTGASEVRFGAGIAVNSLAVLSVNQISVNVTILPAAAPGPRDMTVTTPGGSVTLPDSFRVQQGLPAIVSISPTEGTQGTSLSVLINGSNLDGATSVSFGTGVSVQSFTNISPTQLSINITIDTQAAKGNRDVTVTTPGGSSTLGNSFNIKERATPTLFLALLWIVIAVVVALFIIILNLFRKRRGVNY